MFADRASLEGMAAVTLASWRSHRVKCVVASGSAAEAMGLSEAIAQGAWVRALWNEVVLGLSLREWREQEIVPPLMSVTDSKGNYDHLHIKTVGPGEDRRRVINLAILFPRRPVQTTDVLAVAWWLDGKAQVADALTKLHGDGELLRAVCRQAFTVLVEVPEIMAARRREKGERERVPRVKSPLQLREPVDETSMPVTTTTTVTWRETLFISCCIATSPAILLKDKSKRSMLLLPLYALLWSFVARSALVIPETVLSVDSLLLCHYKQILIQPAHASFPVLLFWARVHPARHQLVRHSRSKF